MDKKTTDGKRFAGDVVAKLPQMQQRLQRLNKGILRNIEKATALQIPPNV